MELTARQKQTFYEEGFIVLRGAIPRLMVDAALQAINHSLGEEGMNKEELPFLRARSYCRDAQQLSALTDLINRSPVFPIVESMIGEGNLLRVGAAQIALRFPGPLFRVPGEPRGHLDGLGTGTNGMEKGVYRRGFTALAVVLLSELTGPYSGNFTVWPKSHRFYEQYFRENGHEMLADGMPKVTVPGEPLQLTGSPGDVVIAHHQILHCAAPNASPHIRYAAIFRLRHKDCEQIGKDAYTDIWKEWPGIREVIETTA